MKNRYPVLLVLFLILIFILVLPSTGCDRLVNITGRVYQWVDPPEKAGSLIFHKEYSVPGILREDLPHGLNLKPLKNVRISAYGQYKTETFYSNEISDEEGNFRLIISLGYKMDSYSTTVEASSEGFIPVRRLITDVGASHIVTFILVPQTAAQ
ncbi:MAG TPA: hypothetical protein VLH15_06990 [Dehalococcoidales bacterium]|nr:hypothetical protein [Dehalococcoidales bacterium]